MDQGAWPRCNQNLAGGGVTFLNNRATRKWSDFSFCDVRESFIYIGGWGKGSSLNMDLKTIFIPVLDKLLSL